MRVSFTFNGASLSFDIESDAYKTLMHAIKTDNSTLPYELYPIEPHILEAFISYERGIKKEKITPEIDAACDYSDQL